MEVVYPVLVLTSTYFGKYTKFGSKVFVLNGTQALKFKMSIVKSIRASSFFISTSFSLWTNLLVGDGQEFMLSNHAVMPVSGRE